jgi:hypothetical protein
MKSARASVRARRELLVKEMDSERANIAMALQQGRKQAGLASLALVASQLLPRRVRPIALALGTAAIAFIAAKRR